MQDGSQIVNGDARADAHGLPGASLISLDAGRLEPVAWDETEHVQITRAFLEAPETFLRHLLDEPT